MPKRPYSTHLDPSLRPNHDQCPNGPTAHLDRPRSPPRQAAHPPTTRVCAGFADWVRIPPTECSNPAQLTTYYLLLTTYYLLLTTYYSLLTTYYLTLTIYYVLLTTDYLHSLTAGSSPARLSMPTPPRAHVTGPPAGHLLLPVHRGVGGEPGVFLVHNHVLFSALVLHDTTGEVGLLTSD